MIATREKALFISHAWTQNQQIWNEVVGWLEQATEFSWKNCSRPCPDDLRDWTSHTLTTEMTRQISTSEAVIILSEMYAANSSWINYEISEAKRLNKMIIGMAPRNQGNVPDKIRESADLMVGGTSSSLVNMVKFLL